MFAHYPSNDPNADRICEFSLKLSLLRGIGDCVKSRPPFSTETQVRDAAEADSQALLKLQHHPPTPEKCQVMHIKHTSVGTKKRKNNLPWYLCFPAVKTLPVAAWLFAGFSAHVHPSSPLLLSQHSGTVHYLLDVYFNNEHKFIYLDLNTFITRLRSA